MKIAFYIEQGIEQLILTPRDDQEKNMLEIFHKGDRGFNVKKGSFYQCKGGWVRQALDEDSTIIVFEPKDPQEAHLGDMFSRGRVEQLLNLLGAITADEKATKKQLRDNVASAIQRFLSGGPILEEKV